MVGCAVLRQVIPFNNWAPFPPVTSEVLCRYAGSALQWASSSFVQSSDGVGLFASLQCDHRTDEVFAWESNTALHSGPNCDRYVFPAKIAFLACGLNITRRNPRSCIAYYGCLNRNCCDKLGLLLSGTKTLQIIAIAFAIIVIGMAGAAAFYIARHVQPRDDKSDDKSDEKSDAKSDEKSDAKASSKSLVFSHLGSESTLGFMGVAIVVAVIVMAVDASRVRRQTTSTQVGLANFPAELPTAPFAEIVLPPAAVVATPTDSVATINPSPHSNLSHFNGTCFQKRFSVLFIEERDVITMTARSFFAATTNRAIPIWRPPALYHSRISPNLPLCRNARRALCGPRCRPASVAQARPPVA